MQDEHNPEQAAVGAERVPRLHWTLMILGPIGLALAIWLSMWSSSRHVERSVNIQVETTWAPGEQLAVRTQILDGKLDPLEPETLVSVAVVDADGHSQMLIELTTVAPGLAQGSFVVPELAPGAAELVVHFEPAAETDIEPFDEHLPIAVVAKREQGQGRQVVSGHILQWADDTDPQPPDVRIDLRPADRLVAGFYNELFVRVTDPAGKPRSGNVQVRLISGEFNEKVGTFEQSPVLYDGPLDELGLARFAGELRSEVVRFEVQLVGGPKRQLRFVSHAGVVRVRASTDFAHPGDELELTVEAISPKKPVYVDVHGPDGAWIDTFTPPLVVPQDQKWTIPAGTGEGAGKAGAVIQFEAYQTILRPEDSSSLARVQVVPRTTTRAASVAELIERQRQQLSLPRVDKEFEIGRERAYLSEVEARVARLDQASVDRTRAFLLGSLETVVHGPTQALNTRAREDETLAAFKLRWITTIRWWLFGGGGLFVVVLMVAVWRNQRMLERETSHALGIDGAARSGDDEALADQSLAIVRARREVLARGAFTVGLAIAALLMTVAVLESFIWK
jgi:hypothetical protein